MMLFNNSSHEITEEGAPYFESFFFSHLSSSLLQLVDNCSASPEISLL
jgi:hypothetical protein